jgi:hypothetical protein
VLRTICDYYNKDRTVEELHAELVRLHCPNIGPKVASLLPQKPEEHKWPHGHACPNIASTCLQVLDEAHLVETLSRAIPTARFEIRDKTMTAVPK